jgi:hypothetical protein
MNTTEGEWTGNEPAVLWKHVFVHIANKPDDKTARNPFAVLGQRPVTFLQKSNFTLKSFTICTP